MLNSSDGVLCWVVHLDEILGQYVSNKVSSTETC